MSFFCCCRLPLENFQMFRVFPLSTDASGKVWLWYSLQSKFILVHIVYLLFFFSLWGPLCEFSKMSLFKMFHVQSCNMFNIMFKTQLPLLFKKLSYSLTISYFINSLIGGGGGGGRICMQPFHFVLNVLFCSRRNRKRAKPEVRGCRHEASKILKFGGDLWGVSAACFGISTI